MRLVSDDTWGILTVYMEARGESGPGKLAVAEVILNRTRQHYCSKGTVASTVLWAYQFSSWNTTDPNRLMASTLDDQDPCYQECLNAWNAAKAGSQTVQGAVLYYNPSIVHTVPDWATPEKSTLVATVGQHQFFVPHPTTAV